MAKRRKPGADDSVLRRLAANNDESAALALLVTLCRQEPKLRHWLWRDFARNPRARSRLAKLIESKNTPAGIRFIELTDDGSAFASERRRLRRRIPAELFGGLTWTELMALVHRHEAGGIELGTFLLAQLWQASRKESPLLSWAGLLFASELMTTSRWRLLDNLKRTHLILSRCAKENNVQSIFGHSDWWKLQALLYILRNPKRAYRVRELRGFLAGRGIDVTTKDIRRFCTRSGIRRDVRAGRPRARADAEVAAR